MGPFLILHAQIFTEYKGALILIRALELSSRFDINDSSLGAMNLTDLVHGLLVFARYDLVGTVHGLAVLTGLESPWNVFWRSKIQTMNNVSEGMLLDVGNTDIIVCVNVTVNWNEFTGQNVDEGGISGTVGTNKNKSSKLEGDLGDLRI